jgi:hypothetical protein
MTTSYKILGQILPTANTLSNVYVVPAATSTIVSTITICNQSSANANVSIAVVPATDTLGNKNYIIKNVLLPAADTLILSPGLTLNAASYITANNGYFSGEPSTANVSFCAFGVELT